MSIEAVLANDRQWHVETTNALVGLRGMPDCSVHCFVTSTPYWGLRDYGVPPSVWGGSDNCEHEWGEHIQPAANGIIHDEGMSGETLSGTSATRKPKKSHFCGKCWAWRGCYGLEPTIEMFVRNTVLIFREARRVLRDDGTLWLNIGDSWNAYNGGSGPGGWNDQRDTERPQLETGYGLRAKDLKPKDLCMVPARVALALQSDGWYLRQDIIWAKPNGMPESVQDRCTKSHEYVFLMAKNERYYYDRLAIGEPLKAASLARLGQDVESQDGSLRANGGAKTNGTMKAVRFGGTKHTAEGQTRLASGNEWEPSDVANKRSVWMIPVGGYRGAHFAVMPNKLAENCIKAGTADRGCCAKCGTPWERLTDSERVPTRPGDGSKVHGKNSRVNKSRDPRHASEYEGKKSVVNALHHASEVGNRDPKRHVTLTVTTGWAPGCECNAASVPCVVADPFNGAGTTGLMAKALGRRYVGFELNPEYADMARRRIDAGLTSEPRAAVEPCEGQKEMFA